MSKTTDRLLSFVGLGKGRRLPPATVEAIAPGLIITSTKAEAWFVIRTSNTDLHSEQQSDAELSRVMSAAGTVLGGRDCHLKIVWGRISGEDYRAEAESFYRAGNWQQWADERAERIDELALPERFVLLGVTLDSDRQSALKAEALGEARDILGAGSAKVSDREIAYYTGLAAKVGRTLASSVLGAQPAPSGLLAWMQAREQRRGEANLPAGSKITGANLVKVTGGRVLPYSDHLRFLDTKGNVSAYGRVLVLSEFPDNIESGGDGGWLLNLSTITRISDEEGHVGEEIGVVADASVRFRVLTRAESLKKLNAARTAAKEQRRSAEKHSAGETSEEITEAELNARDTIQMVSREGTYLVESHVRLTVTGSSLEELDAVTEAVTAHYADEGITVSVGTDEQRDLWLETLPGDQLRITDLGHVQTDVAFFASWFWGGSRVGDRTGPVIGYITGSTAGLSRFNAIGGGLRGDATTTGMIGRSGRGKTTAIMLAEIDAAFQGSWVQHLDFKAEAAGVAHLAANYGLPAAVTKIGTEHAGSFDLFGVYEAEEAALAVARQLALMAPEAYKVIAETAALGAAQRVAKKSPNPTTWEVIEELVTDEKPEHRQLGEALSDLARTPLGSIVAGRPTGKRAFTAKAGVWVLQLPGLNLPSAQINPNRWDVSQRLSMCAMRAVIAHSMSVAGDPALRTMPKLVCVPEVHRLLRTEDGGDFLDQVARMGRATGTNQIIDSQDATGIASIEGIVEQLSAVFGFQMTTTKQQDALAELLHLAPGNETRALIRAIGFATGPDGETEIRKGHCIERDWQDQAATVQIDLPNANVAAMLSTNPDATANVVDLDAGVDESADDELIEQEVSA